MERLNGEIIAGVALVVLALIFILAATMNEVWAIVLPADFLILALGLGFIALGIVTLIKSRREPQEESAHHHH
jgi:putative Ca2+/H+ antiporter (TMEM165/GDT1 family)